MYQLELLLSVYYRLHYIMILPSANLYTISSSNVNTTIIFQLFVILAKFLPILPQKLLKLRKKAGVLPDSSKVDTPLS